MFIATDKAKNLYVVGTDKTSAGDIYLVKYSPEGTVLWQKSWDGPTHLADRPSGLAVTPTFLPRSRTEGLAQSSSMLKPSTSKAMLSLMRLNVLKGKIDDFAFDVDGRFGLAPR